ARLSAAPGSPLARRSPRSWAAGAERAEGEIEAEPLAGPGVREDQVVRPEAGQRRSGRPPYAPRDRTARSRPTAGSYERPAPHARRTRSSTGRRSHTLCCRAMTVDGDYGVPGSLDRVLRAVAAERVAQDRRWGVQEGLADGTGPERGEEAERAKRETAERCAAGSLSGCTGSNPAGTWPGRRCGGRRSRRPVR